MTALADHPEIEAEATAPLPTPPRARRAVGWLREMWVVPVTAALSLWVAYRHPLTFDGGMNLQVAQSVEAGEGYARTYGQKAYFSKEIQTNGPIILLGALLIAVFGQHNLVYQLPNVIFFVAFAWIARSVVQGPFANLLVLLALFGIPDVTQYAYNGFGELPLATFELAAIVLVAKGMGKEDHRLVEAGVFLAGMAVVTKVVGLAVLIPVGIAAVWYVRTSAQRMRAARRLVGALLLGPLLWEAYRFFVFGSVTAWREWWGVQIHHILNQAGAPVDRPVQLPIQHALWQRLGTIAGGYQTGRMTIAIVMAVGVLTLLVSAWRLRRAREHRATAVLRLGLGVMVTAYLTWWLFITPDEKAWLRRVIVGLVFLAIGLAHLVASSAARADLRLPHRPGWADGLRRAPALTGLAIAFTVMVVGPFMSTARSMVDGDDSELRTVEATAAFVAAAPADARFFGVDWWSAPVISAYSQRHFLDLKPFDRCDLRADGDYLVLDRFSTALAFPGKPIEWFHVTGLERHDFGGGNVIWKIGPPPDCP